jgi:hypothetical protein
MSDLRERLRTIERHEVPEYWRDAVSRTPRPLPPGPSPVRRGAVIVVALLLSAAAFGFAIRAFDTGSRRPAEPAATYDNGPIWVQEGGGEAGTRIYALDPATGALRPLWQDGRDPAFPEVPVRPEQVSWDYAFTPDGSRVAFTRSVDEGDGTCCSELFTMKSDGTNLTQLTHNRAYASFPSWSPDGTRLVFSRYDGDRYIAGCELTGTCPADLFVINADGSGEHRITDDSDDEATPTWSPDGSRIAFVRSGGDALGKTIETIRPDGTDARTVLPAGVEFRAWATWSPDGTELAYESAARNERFQLKAVDLETGTVRTIADTGRDTTWGRPTWSPDGTSIAYASSDGFDNQVWVVGSDGSDPHRVLETPRYGVVPLAWQPLPIQASPTPEETLAPPTAFNPTVRQTVQVAANANAILYAAGSLWVPAYEVPGGGGVDRSMLFRLDAHTGEIVDRIPIEATPATETGGGGVAYAHGSIWIAGGSHGGAIVQRVDPGTGTMTGVFPIPGVSGQSIAVDASGLWIGSYGPEAHISHVDPNDGHVLASFVVKGEQVRQMVSVSGVVIGQSLFWTENEGPCGHETVFDPSRDAITTARDIPQCGAYKEIPWHDELWMSGEAFVRIDPSTLQPVGESVAYPTFGPRSFIVVGPDDAIWYAAYPGGNGVRPDTVARFDPTTDSIQEYDVHVGAIAATATEDSIWMLSYDGSITRLALYG